MYSLKQSDRNSSKTDIFHKPTIYEQHFRISHKQKKTFCLTRIWTSRNFQLDNIISSEVIASIYNSVNFRTVSI